MTESHYPNPFHLNDYFNWIESHDLPRTGCPSTNHAVLILEIFHFTVDVWVTRHLCFYSSYWVISSSLPESCAGNDLWVKSGVAGLSWAGPSQKQVEQGFFLCYWIIWTWKRGELKLTGIPFTEECPLTWPSICMCGGGWEVRWGGRWIQYATQIMVSPKIPRVKFLHFYLFVQYN